MPRNRTALPEIPAGFKAANVTGQFGNTHDFEREPLLVGKCQAIQTVKTQNGKQQIMTVQKKDGTLAGVWHSYMLQDLFKRKPIKRDVFIRFEGTKKVPGRKEPMKLFSCGSK